MRLSIVALYTAALLPACGTSEPMTELDTELLTVQTPSFTLQPGEEKFYCYYTTLAVAEAAGVHRVSSRMTPGSHHMIVFKTKTARRPDDTFEECDGFGIGKDISDVPVWLYATQSPEDEVVMPDGVGMALAPSQPVIVNMHYVNSTEAPIVADVHLELERYTAASQYTEAHAFVTFNTDIDIPAGSTGSAGGSCNVDPEAQFVMMSTHSHRYTMTAQIFDGPDMVLETLDWEHATVARFEQPYYKFASGKLDYRCTYHNTTNQPIKTGESAIANEMCMAVGLQFPATGDTFCLNSLTLTL